MLQFSKILKSWQRTEQEQAQCSPLYVENETLLFIIVTKEKVDQTLSIASSFSQIVSKRGFIS